LPPSEIDASWPNSDISLTVSFDVAVLNGHNEACPSDWIGVEAERRHYVCSTADH
jgi:hypothetical protein